MSSKTNILVVGLVGITFGCLGMNALASGADVPDGKLLKGKVTEHDHVRLQRPVTPHLAATATGSGASAAASIETDDFLGGFSNPSKSTPKVTAGGGSSPQSLFSESAELDDHDLVIAWEEWHKRVCSAIYARWNGHATVKAVAHCTLRITRSRQIEMFVRDIEVDRTMFYNGYSPQDLQDEFLAEIKNAVEPLNGDPVLDFPEKSRRREVEFTPYFRGTAGYSGYTWRKDDYERVPGQ